MAMALTHCGHGDDVGRRVVRSVHVRQQPRSLSTLTLATTTPPPLNQARVAWPPPTSLRPSPHGPHPTPFAVCQATRWARCSGCRSWFTTALAAARAAHSCASPWWPRLAGTPGMPARSLSRGRRRCLSSRGNCCSPAHSSGWSLARRYSRERTPTHPVTHTPAMSLTHPSTNLPTHPFILQSLMHPHKCRHSSPQPLGLCSIPRDNLGRRSPSERTAWAYTSTRGSLALHHRCRSFANLISHIPAHSLTHSLSHSLTHSQVLDHYFDNPPVGAAIDPWLHLRYNTPDTHGVASFSVTVLSEQLGFPLQSVIGLPSARIGIHPDTL